MKIIPVKYEVFKETFPKEKEVKGREYLIVYNANKNKPYLGVVKDKINGKIDIRKTNNKLSDNDKESCEFDYNLLSALSEPFRKDLVPEAESSNWDMRKQKLNDKIKKYKVIIWIDRIATVLITGGSLFAVLWLINSLHK